mmetsp:Transcript_12164/g.19460  ORF Transcript_12164/g.19460 Transcript_12164/m.19460 type:complete len:112 (-) Transcript_12164:127-462(-)
MALFNTTELFESTTEYIATTDYVSTRFTSTGEDMQLYPDISADPVTEAFLAVFSITVAVILVTCYIRDLLIAGVCKKGYRHYEDADGSTEETLAAAIQSASDTKALTANAE